MEIRFTVEGVYDFNKIAKKAKKLATQEKTTAEFTFNEVKCIVNKDTVINWLIWDYDNALRMGWKVIGPTPSATLQTGSEDGKKSKQT